MVMMAVDGAGKGQKEADRGGDTHQEPNRHIQTQPDRLSAQSATFGGGRRGQLGTDTDDADDDVASAAAAAADGNGIHELQRTQARTDTARHSQRGRSPKPQNPTTLKYIKVI